MEIEKKSQIFNVINFHLNDQIIFYAGDEKIVCPFGQMLVEKPEGLICMPDMREKWRRQGPGKIVIE